MVRFHLSPPQLIYNQHTYYVWNYKRVVQEKRGKIFEIVRWYIEKILTKFDTAIRSLELQSKYIEKYIDEIR